MSQQDKQRRPHDDAAGLTRRDILRLGGRVCLATGASHLIGGCTSPCTPAEPTPSPTDSSPRVAVIRGDNLAEMAREALAAFGGASAIVSSGETVFIKPNFGSLGMVKYNPIARGESVKPEIVIAVAEECLKAGASMVTIGEGSQVPSWDWSTVPFLDGSTNMADAVQQLNDTYGDRVRLVCLNAETPEWIAVPSQSCLSTVDVSNLILQADRVISLPVIKTHRWTLTTGALKNLFGTTPISHYNSPLISNMRQGLHDAGLHQVLVDINKAVGIDFAITDFSLGCEGNGPHVLPGWWGTTVDVRDRLGTWMLLASTDPVALDATSTRVISLNAEDVTHVRLAYEQGLGQILEDKITLSGATLDEIRMPWQAPQLTEGFLEVVIPGIHLLTDA
jgi:uncharacterized protein (DUF362 family)